MQKPPFVLNTNILNLSAKIHELLGELKSYNVLKPHLKLRKASKIKTIHHSLAIEGNHLSEKQITAILDNKRIIGPEQQIQEVQNAFLVYNDLSKFNPLSEKDLLTAHKCLTKGLIKNPGKYRTTQVGIFKGKKVSHVAPPAKLVPQLMHTIFEFLQKDQNSFLIKGY